MHAVRRHPRELYRVLDEEGFLRLAPSQTPTGEVIRGGRADRGATAGAVTGAGVATPGTVGGRRGRTVLLLAALAAGVVGAACFVLRVRRADDGVPVTARLARRVADDAHLAVARTARSPGRPRSHGSRELGRRTGPARVDLPRRVDMSPAAGAAPALAADARAPVAISAGSREFSFEGVAR